MGDRLGVLLLRCLLRLLPGEARAEFAPDIELLARARRAELGRVGRRAVGLFWARELSAAARGTAEAWVDVLGARSARPGRATTTGGTMEGVIQDLRFAMRSVRRSPAVSAAVVVTLAVGLGSTLAVFSLVDGVLLHPIPVPEPERVVRVFQALNERSPLGGTSFPTLQDYRSVDAGVEGPAGFFSMDVGFRADAVSERVSAGLVSGDFFEVLRVPAALGRPLLRSDDEPDAAHVVVLGHALWARIFASDPAVLGRTIRISGESFEVVGVAPEGFSGVTLEAAPELWIPLTRVREASSDGLYASTNVLETRAFAWIDMVARLRGDESAEGVASRLGAVARGLRDELGDRSGQPEVDPPVQVVPLVDGAVTAQRNGLLRFVGLLGGVVLLSLLVTCANAAHLLMARAHTRRRDVAVRQALGAGRGSLVRHVLSESLMLASIGGGLGLGLAALSTRAVRSFSLPGGVPLSRVDLGLDGRLVLVTLALTVATALAFGLMPALAQSRHEVAQRVREGARSPTAGRGRLPYLLVIQVGVSVVLAVGALLFTRTLEAAFGTEMGFDVEGLAAVSLAFRGHGYAAGEIPGIADRIVDEVEAPGTVRSAAFATHVPLGPSSMRLAPIPVDADTERASNAVHINVVTPGYFETLGVELLAGRGFATTDGAEAPEVVVLNRAAAQLLWPGGSPLGRELVLVRGLDPIAVVGVVQDHKVHGVADEDVPYLYLALAQSPQLAAGGLHLLARAESDAGAALEVLRERVRASDPGLPVHDARLVERQIERVLMPQRFGGLLLGLLSAATLLVSAVAVYGMVTFEVRRRTRELGIRMALGAGPRRVVLSTVGGAGAAVALGIGLGLALASGLSRFVAEYLFGVAPLDPASYGGGALLLALAALLAAAVPARRAVTINPRDAIADDT